MGKRKTMYLHTILTYGKYRGNTVKMIWEVDPAYIEWYTAVTWKGLVADEVSLLYRPQKEEDQLK